LGIFIFLQGFTFIFCIFLYFSCSLFLPAGDSSRRRTCSFWYNKSQLRLSLWCHNTTPRIDYKWNQKPKIKNFSKYFDKKFERKICYFEKWKRDEKKQGSFHSNRWIIENCLTGSHQKDKNWKRRKRWKSPAGELVLIFD